MCVYVCVCVCVCVCERERERELALALLVDVSVITLFASSFASFQKRRAKTIQLAPPFTFTHLSQPVTH